MEQTLKGLQRIHFEVFKWLMPQLLSLWLVSDLIMTEIFVKMMFRCGDDDCARHSFKAGQLLGERCFQIYA